MKDLLGTRLLRRNQIALPRKEDGYLLATSFSVPSSRSGATTLPVSRGTKCTHLECYRIEDISDTWLLLRCRAEVRHGWTKWFRHRNKRSREKHAAAQVAIRLPPALEA